METGVVFDSNVDTAFKHPGLYDVRMWEVGSSIMGWTDALQQMRGGMKATVYIPSTLGYGKNGNGDRIKPDAILVFDMDIAKVQSEDAYNAEQTKLQEEAMKKMFTQVRRVEGIPGGKDALKELGAILKKDGK